MNTFIKVIFTLGVLFSFYFTSCKKKDERICPKSECTLTFDYDTLFFDTTVFSGIKTITKRLRVFNTNKNAVTISEISIPENSPFQLVIDGERKNSVSDFFLRGEDELLILVEATVDESPEEDSIFIVQENLKFVTNDVEQQVVLVAPSINVYFHNEETVACNTVWKNDRPHVIYNSILVPENCKLTIEEGTYIFSHSKSAIIVEGTIEAIGTPEKRILFSDDRIDDPSTYEDIFGIWEGILLLPGSERNKFEWVRINNAVSGIRVNYLNKYDVDDNGKLIIDPDYEIDMSGGSYELEFSHSIINTIGNNVNAPSFTGGLPFSGIGIIGRNCDMLIHNSLITNCTVGSIMTLLNGTYQIINNTLVNYSSANASFSRPKEVRSFYASTILADATGIVEGGEMQLSLVNNIIYGENSDPEEENNLDEITLSSTEEYALNVNLFNNNIIKTEEFKDVLNFGDNILNQNPLSDTVTRKEDYDFTLESNSVAIDAGTPLSGVSGLEIDLNGNLRDAFWDIGAYEYIP